MNTSFTASWHHTLIAGAVLALSACGGGSDNEPTPTPPTPTPTPPTTAELVQKFVTAYEVMTASQLPTSGAERFALLDACYLGNGRTKSSLIESWTEASQTSNAYLVGRTLQNVQILDERKTTNADGSARLEVDIGYDEKYTDGTTLTDQRETLVAGKTSGTCDTPQDSDDLRMLGNQRVVQVQTMARNITYVFNRLSDGELTGAAVRREVRLRVIDPASKATYAIARWTGANGPLALKLLSPRLARDAAEMQGKRGNGTYTDTDAFRICSSDSGNIVTIDATTADCTQYGVTGENWGYPVNAPYTAEKLAYGDTQFAMYGWNAGSEITYEIYNDDGWKTVNGQQGKTPIATYKTTLRYAPYTFAEMAASPAAYPALVSSSLSNAALVAAAKGSGGSTDLVWTAALPPTGGLPLVAADLYFYRQGSNTGTGASIVRKIESIAPGATATSATLPIGGKPDGAASTNYAEGGLTYMDRNGRQVFLGIQFR